MKPECANHAMWSKQLVVAYWIFWLVGMYIVLFTEDTLVGGITIGLAFALFVTDIVLDIRHVRWHMKNGEDKNHHFKQ